MSTHKLIVWSVWPDVAPDTAWDALTDVGTAGLPWPLSWRHPDARTAVVRAASVGDVPGALTVGPVVVAATTRVVGGVPGWRVTTRTTVLGVTLVHRRRLERVLGGGVRATDEVVVSGPALRVAAASRAWRRQLVARHEALTASLAPGAKVTAHSRVYVLDRGNAAHAVDSLTGLPDDTV